MKAQIFSVGAKFVAVTSKVSNVFIARKAKTDPRYRAVKVALELRQIALHKKAANAAFAVAKKNLKAAKQVQKPEYTKDEELIWEDDTL